MAGNQLGSGETDEWNREAWLFVARREDSD
jgi:hypothetical protein